MHKDPALVTASITIGASGAVSSFVGATVQSVTTSATGVYTITLQPQTSFPSLYFAAGSMQSPASGLSGIVAVEIQNAPNASVANSTGAVLTVKTLSASDALAAPAAGSVLNVLMFFSNSSIVIDGE